MSSLYNVVLINMGDGLGPTSIEIDADRFSLGHQWVEFTTGEGDSLESVAAFAAYSVAGIELVQPKDIPAVEAEPALTS